MGGGGGGGRLSTLKLGLDLVEVNTVSSNWG